MPFMLPNLNLHLDTGHITCCIGCSCICCSTNTTVSNDVSITNQAAAKEKHGEKQPEQQPSRSAALDLLEQNKKVEVIFDNKANLLRPLKWCEGWCGKAAALNRVAAEKMYDRLVEKHGAPICAIILAWEKIDFLQIRQESQAIQVAVVIKVERAFDRYLPCKKELTEIITLLKQQENEIAIPITPSPDTVVRPPSRSPSEQVVPLPPTPQARRYLSPLPREDDPFIEMVVPDMKAQEPPLPRSIALPHPQPIHVIGIPQALPMPPAPQISDKKQLEGILTKMGIDGRERGFFLGKVEIVERYPTLQALGEHLGEKAVKFPLERTEALGKIIALAEQIQKERGPRDTPIGQILATLAPQAQHLRVVPS